LSAALRIDVADKQALLEELDVDLRSDLLLEKIHELLPQTLPERAARGFPPKFSMN
jgi:hypothetical protein